MKILYATARPPYPPEKGDQLIAFEQIKKINKQVDIHLVSLNDGLCNEEFVRGKLEEYCKTIHFVQSGKSASRLIHSLYNQLPFQVNLFYDRFVKRQIDELVQKIEPDLIHVQTIRISEYFRYYKYPKILDMIDSLSLNMKRRGQEDVFPRKYVFQYEAHLLAQYERDMISDFSSIFLVSRSDAANYQSNRFVINPNGTYITRDLVQKYKNQPKTIDLIFHGNMQYFPNVDAVLYFYKRIFPKLLERKPNLKLYIVGRNPAPQIRKLHDGQNLFVTGQVSDMVEYLMKSVIGVYPLKSGSGMQNKILEAMSCGLPVVASSMAIQGIEYLEEGTHVIIADNDEEWISSILGLLDDKFRQAQYGLAGQTAIIENYSWESNSQRLLAEWKRVIQTWKA